MHTCVGVRLSNTFMKYLLAGLLENMPDEIDVMEDQVEVDGSWLAERIITRMPILVG